MEVVNLGKISLKEATQANYDAMKAKADTYAPELFKEGQEFITDVFSASAVPAGFCPWAWDDIYKSLVGFAADGNYGMWYENKNTIIACCTDGTRPVYFKIEKVRESSFL